MLNKRNSKYFLTILLSCILISCAPERDVQLDDLYLGDDSLLYKKRADIPYTGIAVSYENGTLKSSANIVSGKYEGTTKRFYNNGALASKWPYIDNKIDGVVEMFYTNGSLSQKRFYNNDKLERAEFFNIVHSLNDPYSGTPSAQGVLQGALSRLEKYVNEKKIYSEAYSQRGDLLSVENFDDDGKYHGLVIKYERNYCNSNSSFLCSDELVSKSITTYNNGIAHGNAKKMYEFETENGSPFTQDDSNPQSIKSTNFVNGIVDGQVIKNGGRSTIVTCKNGKANGPNMVYFRDGRLQSIGEWKDNKRHGIYEIYSSARDHHLWKSETWTDGVFRSCNRKAALSWCDGSKAGFKEFSTCAASSAEDL